MWLYLFNIIISPFVWLWNNVINMPIYGVTVFSVFLVLAITSACFRFFIFPYIVTGFNPFPGTHVNLSSTLNRFQGNVKDYSRIKSMNTKDL